MVRATTRIKPTSMSQEYDISIPPPVRSELSRSFSNYGDPNVMCVEHWLYHGGEQPADEVIRDGFPVLYNHIYFVDLHGHVYWSHGYYLTQTQRERWEVMEPIAGLDPIMATYQEVCERRRAEKDAADETQK